MEKRIRTGPRRACPRGLDPRWGDEGGARGCLSHLDGPGRQERGPQARPPSQDPLRPRMPETLRPHTRKLVQGHLQRPGSSPPPRTAGFGAESGGPLKSPLPELPTFTVGVSGRGTRPDGCRSGREDTPRACLPPGPREPLRRNPRAPIAPEPRHSSGFCGRAPRSDAGPLPWPPPATPDGSTIDHPAVDGADPRLVALGVGRPPTRPRSNGRLLRGGRDPPRAPIPSPRTTPTREPGDPLRSGRMAAPHRLPQAAPAPREAQPINPAATSRCPFCGCSGSW